MLSLKDIEGLEQEVNTVKPSVETIRLERVGNDTVHMSHMHYGYLYQFTIENVVDASDLRKKIASFMLPF